MAELKRKGARTMKDVPADILARLNRGEIETANLVEFLAIDARALLENVLAQSSKKKYLKPILARVDKLEKRTTVAVSYAVAVGLAEQIALHSDADLLRAASAHTSDLVRSWAAVVVGKNGAWSIGQTLEKIKPFAADHHFNVRECAWSAVRQNIIQRLDESLKILATWAGSKDENIRRFASEATRPRGVWCEHIAALKENPAPALPILEPLKSDPSRYVQNSVGNWLNDASKTQPEFVRKLCRRWEKESGTKETQYIIKRALRTLNK